MAKTSFRRVDAITKKDVQSALSAVYSQQTYELADGSETGLSLRVRARSAAWWLRGRLGPKQTYWRIADLRPDDDPKEIRRRAAEAKLMLARGVDPKDWLGEQERGGPVERHFDEARDGWTWQVARDKYLDHIKASRAPATHADYRRTLCSGDFEPWVRADRLVKAITKQDVQSLQTSIYERGAVAQAGHVVRILKACLAWVADTGKSGMDTSPATTVRPIAKTKQQRAEDEAEARVPTPAEVGALPWKLDAARTNAAARLAAMLALLTVQRRETIVTARRRDFEPVEDGAVWQIPAAHIKSKRGHVLPLPPLTWRVVRAAMTLGNSSDEWLFPQLRLRRAGDAGTGHMASKELNDAMTAAGSPIRPHACRRAFGTHGEALLGNKRSDTKAILDHAEGQSGDVTAQRYALHDGRHFKWGIMRRWESWVLEQMAAQRPDGTTDDLPSFLRPVT